MDELAFLDGEWALSLERAGLRAGAAERKQAAELWDLRRSRSPEPASLASAERAGELGAASGDAVEEVVRRALIVGRMLARAALSARLLQPDEANRIAFLTDEAAVRAAAAHARFLRNRRDEWLSFFAHELKNPLNTVLNAIWLIREGRGGVPADRFLQLAERAVHRMESTIGELRDLDHRSLSPPPWAALPEPVPPSGTRGF